MDHDIRKEQKMSRLNTIPGYEGMVYYLLKFGRHKEYLESLRSGNIYMDRFRTYVEQERREKMKGQGDSYEASLVVHALSGEFRDPETDKLLFEIGPSTLILTSSDFLDRPVFCSMALDASMLEVVDDCGEYYNTRVMFSDEQKELLPKVFGEHVVSIEFPVFFDRMHSWFYKHKMPVIAGMVDYEDYSKMTSKRAELFNKQDPNFFLIKDNKLAYQNEYRFVPFTLETTEPMIINVGDLSEITQIHNSVELLNSEIFLKVAKVDSSKDTL
jgi:hypothetical protein